MDGEEERDAMCHAKHVGSKVCVKGESPMERLKMLSWRLSQTGQKESKKFTRD
jgi:hypothetical protein